MFEVGTLEIEDNIVLTSLIGLAGIDEVVQSLIIVNNPMLSELTGIPSATNLERLSINNNNFSVNSNLASVGAGKGIPAQIVASNLDAFSNLESVSGDLSVSGNPTLADCSGLRKVLDDIDDGDEGPGPGVDGIPDVSGIVRIEQNLPGCNSIEQILGSGNGDEEVFADGFESEN